MDDLSPARRELLVGGLMTAMMAGLASGSEASPLNPEQTIIIPKANIPWAPNPAYPAKCQDNCVLVGDINKPGLYLTLIRWYPGFMSAPHTYVTDRICMVLSGDWYCNSGPDYDPAMAVPAPAGSFVRRVAGTPHYDGVPTGKAQPCEVAVFGMGPVQYKLVDPSRPGWRPA